MSPDRMLYVANEEEKLQSVEETFDYVSLSPQERMIVNIVSSSEKINEEIGKKYTASIVSEELNISRKRPWSIRELLAVDGDISAKKKMVEDLKKEILSDIILLKRYLYDCYSCTGSELNVVEHAAKGIRYEMWTLRCLLAKKEQENPDKEEISHFLPFTEKYINFADLTLPECIIVQLLFTEDARRELGERATSMEDLSALVRQSKHFRYRSNVYHFIEAYLKQNVAFAEKNHIPIKLFIKAMRAGSLSSVTLLELLQKIEKEHDVVLVPLEEATYFDSLSPVGIEYSSNTYINFQSTRNIYTFFKEVAEYHPGYLHKIGIQNASSFLKQILLQRIPDELLIKYIKEIEAITGDVYLETEAQFNSILNKTSSIIAELNLSKREDIYYLFQYISEHNVGWLKAIGIENEGQLLQDILTNRIYHSDLQQLVRMAAERFATTLFTYEEKFNTSPPSEEFLLQHLDLRSRSNIYFMIEMLSERNPSVLEQCGILDVEVFLEYLSEERISRFLLVDILKYIELHYGFQLVSDLSSYASIPFAEHSKGRLFRENNVNSVQQTTPIMNSSKTELSTPGHVAIARQISEFVKRQCKVVSTPISVFPKTAVRHATAVFGTLLLTTSSIIGSTTGYTAGNDVAHFSQKATPVLRPNNTSTHDASLDKHKTIQAIVSQRLHIPQDHIMLQNASTSDLVLFLELDRKLFSFSPISHERMGVLLQGALHRGITSIGDVARSLNAFTIRDGEGISQAHLRHMKNIYGNEWSVEMEQRIILYYERNAERYPNVVEVGDTYILPVL